VRLDVHCQDVRVWSDILASATGIAAMTGMLPTSRAVTAPPTQTVCRYYDGGVPPKPFVSSSAAMAFNFGLLYPESLTITRVPIRLDRKRITNPRTLVSKTIVRREYEYFFSIQIVGDFSLQSNLPL
jgi:hypothetical protein